MKAILLMAHGAPANLEDVEPYVLRVRHGRPLEAQLMESIQDRYRRIGGSPLLLWTRRQAAGLEDILERSATDTRVFIGMRYSHPFIHEAVQEMIESEVREFVGICMAPQFSSMTIGAYRKALKDAMKEIAHNHPVKYAMVNSYARHPFLIDAFAERLNDILKQCQPDTAVVFTAHSLPERVLQEGDPYDAEVKQTASAVATECKLQQWKFAYQSQGLTTEKWLGPTVESVIDELAVSGCKCMIVCPIGFVCDHVEILYDIDVMYKEYAQQKGIELHRTQSLNDSPLFIRVLAEIASDQSLHFSAENE